MDVELTKSAEALLCLIYKDFLKKRSGGADLFVAKHIGSSETIHSSITPSISFSDTDELCRELGRVKLLNISYADNICYNINLTDKAIIYMEERFQRSVDSVLEYLAKIKNAVPFL